MWIRSQDRLEIIKADCIAIDFHNGLWSRIYAQSNDRLMGEYASEAEALKVLDEFEFALVLGAEEVRTVFRMPPKGFTMAEGE